MATDITIDDAPFQDEDLVEARRFLRTHEEERVKLHAEWHLTHKLPFPCRACRHVSAETLATFIARIRREASRRSVSA